MSIDLCGVQVFMVLVIHEKLFNVTGLIDNELT